MAEAEIIIKSWNPKMAKNQVSHFLVTGKKEPPNLVNLPCSVPSFAQTNLFYFLFNLIGLIFKDGRWFASTLQNKMPFFHIIIKLSLTIWKAYRVIATISFKIFIFFEKFYASNDSILVAIIYMIIRETKGTKVTYMYLLNDYVFNQKLSVYNFWTVSKYVLKHLFGIPLFFYTAKDDIVND